MGSVFTTVNDYVANGSFSSLKKNVKIYHTPNYAYLIRLIDASNKWKGPWIYTDKKGYIFLKKSSLKPKDILLSNVGANVGKTFLVPNLDKPMTLAPNSVLLRSSKYSNDYLFYLLNNPKNKYRLLSLVSISAQPKLNKTDFKNLQLNITNIFSEQEHLGKLINIIDHLISLQQRKYKILLNLQNTLLMSTLKFKPKVDPVVYFKTSSNKIEKFLLKDVARITMGQSPSSKNYFEKPVGEVLIQGNADIKKNSIYPRIWTTEVTKEVNIGDILLTVRAPVGEVAIADRKAVIGRGVAGISTNNQVIFYYLKLIKNTHIWDRLSSGSTFQSISSKDINNLPLYLPNQETQLKIGKLLNSVLKKISVEENKINTTEELKQFLLQNMFI